MALQLARDLKIRPRASTSDQWPWPVKVYTLGEFKLLIDNQAPTYSRKMPKKVLALLKLIICWDCKDVSVEKITDALWPDADGGSAQDSMSATLRRLRRLLGNPEAIRQSGGQVTLNSEICWVDAMAFERQLDGDQDMQLQERALQLYRGAFLGNDDSAAWMVPMREHLRAKFTDAVGKLGASFEEAGRDDDAIALYLHGIEADNLIEPFYRGLMRCHERKGERSEAINTYRRLRDILSVALGIEPSSATRRIMESLRER
jgi:DNA-binding SARP family transcriptional activator